MGDEVEPDIIGRIDRLSESVDRLAVEYSTENLKRDERIKASQRAIRWAIGVAAFGLVVALVAVSAGLWGITVGNRSAHNLHESQQATQVARIASCMQSNRQQTDNVAAQIKLSEDFVAALTAGTTRPEIAARAAAFNKAHDDLIRHAYPLRDCSPAGVAAFLNQHS